MRLAFILMTLIAIGLGLKINRLEAENEALSREAETLREYKESFLKCNGDRIRHQKFLNSTNNLK